MFDNGTNDWIYMIKKALNSKVYTNLDLKSNIIDIITNELYDKYHDNVKLFRFDDATNTITVKVNSSAVTSDIRDVFNISIIRFCHSNRYHIEQSIREVAGINYQKIFSDIIENNQNALLCQLITIHAFVVNNETTATVRFF